jgi:hypothetical protein
MYNFIKPNKFKILFTIIAVLFGGSFVGMFLNVLGFFQFRWIGSQNIFLDFLHNSVTNLFSHFILQAQSDCLNYGGGGFDFVCFFTQMFKILILQSIIYYLLSCSLYNKNWKIRFWRIYFFLIALIHLRLYTGILFYPNDYNLNSIEIYLDIPITTIALLGLFLLAAEKRFLGSIFWKVYFFLYISWDIIIRVTYRPFILQSVIHGIIPLIPLYIALFLYGFKTFKSKKSYLLEKKHQ